MAAKELIQLSFLRISEGLADFTWIDLHFQFMSGITMILIIWKNVEARNKAQEDWVSLKSSLFQWKLILERIGARWERIGRAREVLSKLADATVDLVEKDPTRSTGALQARPLQSIRETRRSQRHSIIQRLRNLSQQDQSQARAHRDSCLPYSNTVPDRGTIQLCNKNNNNRNPERRGQDMTNMQELPAGPAGWSWTDSDTNLQQETALGSQAVGNASNWEAEETLWPLLNLSDITAGSDELDLWAYFSAPMLGMENLAIPNFNAGIRPDESLNNSILNFQGDLDHLPPQIGANGTEGSGYTQ
ncbi:unnamed protein product [Fusarium langsethiae]|nr:unnamed protein product [Fusarium langsethiae]